MKDNLRGSIKISQLAIRFLLGHRDVGVDREEIQPYLKCSLVTYIYY